MESRCAAQNWFRAWNSTQKFSSARVSFLVGRVVDVCCFYSLNQLPIGSTWFRSPRTVLIAPSLCSDIIAMALRLPNRVDPWMRYQLLFRSLIESEALKSRIN